MSSYFDKPQFEELKERMDRIEERLDDHYTDLNQRMTRIDLALQKIMDHLHVGNDQGQAHAARTAPELTKTEAAPTETAHVVLDGPYPYTALDPTKSQIRILELYSAPSSADTLFASLKNIDLAEPPVTFTALSYCWGPPIMDHFIVVDNYQVPITKSLDSALRYLRDFYTDGISVWEKYLWIDQLCINQSDLDERSSQVSLMRRIYKKAENDHVWLGDESDTSSKAIDLLTILGAPPENAPGEAIQYLSLSEADVKLNWMALGSFFTRPWFERVWIRQEIALHEKVLLSCGNKTLDIAVLEPALLMIDHVKSMGYDSASWSTGHTYKPGQLPWDYHPSKLIQLRKATGSGAHWVQLGQLIQDVRGCEAKDTRDMVFSIIGMADPGAFTIMPDYRGDLRSIYITAAKHALCEEKDLDILAVCQNPRRRHGLPSWVPNLADRWNYLPFDAQRIKKERDNFHFRRRGIHPNWGKMDNSYADVQVQGDILILKGEFIDEINWISPDMINYTSTAAQMEDVYKSWNMLVEEAYTYGKCVWRRLLENYRHVTDNGQKHWIYFLSAFGDEGLDVEEHEPDRLRQKQRQKRALPQYQRSLNPNLARSYLLPAKGTAADLHPNTNSRIHMAMLRNCVGRRFCITRKGMVGLGPEDTKTGLHIALFRGSPASYVIG
ncbi:hypothetical protein PSPO01_02071 [Paraphaeosphaeria sporulosa]